MGKRVTGTSDKSVRGACLANKALHRPAFLRGNCVFNPFDVFHSLFGTFWRSTASQRSFLAECRAGGRLRCGLQLKKPGVVAARLFRGEVTRAFYFRVNFEPPFQKSHFKFLLQKLTTKNRRHHSAALHRGTWCYTC